jgi:hypothetical protein
MSKDALATNSIEKNTRCSSIQEFADRLRRWHDLTEERVIGGSANRGQTAWLWVCVEGYECYLNADSNRNGVAEFLRFVNRYGAGLTWHVRTNRNGAKINKICFGPDASSISGFFLYVKPPLLSEGMIRGNPISFDAGSTKPPAASLAVKKPDARNEFAFVPISTIQRGIDTEFGQGFWRELGSIAFVDGCWSMKPIAMSAELGIALSSLRMIDTGSRRHAASVEIGGDTSFCQIAITQRRDPIGCRVLAAAIEKMTGHFGGVESVPEKIYIRARTGSAIRQGKLIMLQAFADPATRREIARGFSYLHLPDQPGESHLDYQVRAVNVVRNLYEGCEWEDPSKLNFARMQSQPDGLFKREQSKELIIVEAKQRRPDFEEGTAQIMQYFAQAKHCGRYADWQMRLCLVTSESEATEGYTQWQEWMQSSKQLNVFVAD